MQLPPFVLIEHPTELKDKTLIMATSPPYIIGQVWRFTERHEKVQFWTRQEDDAPFAELVDYNICATFYGSLEDIGKPKDAQIDVAYALKQMLDFYHDVRIVPNAPRFNRYKIDR